jgi:RimJ/RimL family protein N-acetyltransferase
MFGWRSDADTARFLSGAAPKSIEDQLDWFETVCRDTSYSYHIIEYQNVPIGFTSMFNADPAQPEAEWGVVIGESRGQGLVQVIAPLCCISAFKFGELENLYTCINAKNGPAMRKMEQMGAARCEESSIYRKKGELLFRINSYEFKKTLSTLADTSPAVTDELDVEMHIVETSA